MDNETAHHRSLQNLALSKRSYDYVVCDIHIMHLKVLDVVIHKDLHALFQVICFCHVCFYIDELFVHLLLSSAVENNYIVSLFEELQNIGISDIWIGVSGE